MQDMAQGQAADAQGEGGIPRYAYFALFVLILSNLLNYIDRQILSILAHSIREDLHLDDAQLGFLMGTSFAVFYAVVGIAMGRISDMVSRKHVMAFGLALWSLMTAMGGLAVNFATLAAARIGVGVGEATANPCSHSLLSDYFPPRNRAFALGAYLTGTHLGSALSLLLGGIFLQHWTDFCGLVPWAGACGIPPWKAALLAVGLPGIPLALLVLTLREPPREQATQGVGRIVVTEFATALPPFTALTLYRVGGSGALARNVALVALIVGVAAGLILITGDVAQWAAIGLGIYAVSSWAQVQRYRDPPLHRLTFGCRTFMLAVLSSAVIACIGGGVHIWAAPYAIRELGVPPAQTGLALGVLFSLGAVIGVLVGGYLTDIWKRRDPRAPIFVAAISVLSGLPSVVLMMSTHTPAVFFFACFTFMLTFSLWGGGFAALVQDLVLPRMRGTAASAFSLVSIVVASGAGPYWAGKVSTLTGSLSAGLLSMQLMLPLALVLLWATARRLVSETLEGRRASAEAAGERRLATA